MAEPTGKMAEATDSPALFDGYKSFYGCLDLSDFTIVCGARKWRVHKLVMSANSSFFKKACTGEFKEAKDDFIELREDDAQAVAAMIYYLYHGHYDASKSKEPGTSDHVFNLLVYIIGDKYAVTGLSKLAEARVHHLINMAWKADGFGAVIKAIYEKDLPDDRIRKRAVRVAHWARRTLFSTFGRFEKFNEVAQSTPAFLYDLMQFDVVRTGPLAELLLIPTKPADQIHSALQAVRTGLSSLDRNVPGYVARAAAHEYLLDWYTFDLEAIQKHENQQAALPR